MSEPEILRPDGARPPRPTSATPTSSSASRATRTPATIGHVVQAAQTGLAKYFPERSRVVLNSDGGSTDGTPRRRGEQRSARCRRRAGVAPGAPDPPPQRPVSRAAREGQRVPHHLPGGRTARGAGLRRRRRRPAQHHAGVDPPPASPRCSNQGVDYVAPYYHRHKFDGTITNNVVYPVTRALYGQQIRQPIGGDFGVSRALVQHYLGLPVWETRRGEVRHRHLDDHEAICGGFSRLPGVPRREAPRPEGPGGRPERHARPGAGHGVPPDGDARGTLARGQRFGSRCPWSASATTSASIRSRSNPARMIDHFRRGVRDLESIWRTDVRPRRPGAAEAGRLAVPAPALSIDDRLWARLVYDLAVAYHRRVERARRAGALHAAALHGARRVVRHGNGRCRRRRQVEARIEHLCASSSRRRTTCAGAGAERAAFRHDRVADAAARQACTNRRG